MKQGNEFFFISIHFSRLLGDVASILLEPGTARTSIQAVQGLLQLSSTATCNFAELGWQVAADVPAALQDPQQVCAGGRMEVRWHEQNRRGGEVTEHRLGRGGGWERPGQ